MTDNTRQSFQDKWHHNERLAFDETLRDGSEIQRWILSRNGFVSREALSSYLKNVRRMLDAGCGNGRVTALLRECTSPGSTEILAIDAVSADVASRNLSSYENVKVLARDLLSDLRDLGRFDFIYCQEVLHHTEDPQGAFLNLCAQVEVGGEIAVYLYKKKGPAREFVDQFVHRRIAALPYGEAIKTCEQLALLGKALSECKATVEVPRIEALEIAEGRYDVQRFIYHYFCKCFWNPDLSLEENTAINYDWYHPDAASRHTLKEVRGWFGDAGLTIVHECVDLYGITVRGRRS
jgi:SAM-dependent methyltransferase